MQYTNTNGHLNTHTHAAKLVLFIRSPQPTWKIIFVFSRIFCQRIIYFLFEWKKFFQKEKNRFFFVRFGLIINSHHMIVLSSFYSQKIFLWIVTIKFHFTPFAFASRSNVDLFNLTIYNDYFRFFFFIFDYSFQYWLTHCNPCDWESERDSPFEISN